MSDFMEKLAALRDAKDFTALIDAIPYARLMGVEMGKTKQASCCSSYRLPNEMSAIQRCRHCTAG
jgi:ferric iron reductase protein FhuF